MPHKAIFLDRDGVINVDNGYVHKSDQVTFVDGVFEFCKKATSLGYLIVVVTNQSGIGRGLYTETEFHALMQWMKARFKREGAAISSYYFCPHHPEEAEGAYKMDCQCRKPKPGMILRAVRDLDIDLAQSLLIGDKTTDLDAGRAAGVGNCVRFKGDFPFEMLA